MKDLSVKIYQIKETIKSLKKVGSKGDQRIADTVKGLEIALEILEAK